MLPPSPRAKRATSESGAERHEQQEDPVERRQQLAPEESRIRRGRGPADRRSRSVRHGLSPLPEEGVPGAEQGAHGHHGRRHGAERRLGEGRKRLLAVRREAEFLERHGRQVQHARPAQLLLAVDVVDVPVGPVGDALVRERQHLVPRAVAQGVGRARLDAGWNRHGVGELPGRLVGQRLLVERDRRRLGERGRRSACTSRSSGRASSIPRSARPRDTPAGSIGSRCSRRRCTTPDRRLCR